MPKYRNQSSGVQVLCFMAILCALEVALSRIAGINIGNYLKISFGFIPIAVCGILMGPWCAAAVAAVADIVGALLFPTGPFFPGFTLVAAVGGMIYGLFLFHKKPNILRCLLCTLTVAVICNICLNTIFLCMTGAIVPPGNDAFLPTLWTRVLKNAIQFAVNGVIIFSLWKLLEKLPAKYRV